VPTRKIAITAIRLKEAWRPCPAREIGAAHGDGPGPAAAATQERGTARRSGPRRPRRQEPTQLPIPAVAGAGSTASGLVRARLLPRSPGQGDGARHQEGQPQGEEGIGDGERRTRDRGRDH